MEKDDLQRKLARAVLAFQDSYLARENSPVGLLCQVWLPEHGPNGLELKTKGMPFCVAGMGDLLALFRCISCRFNFGADPQRLSQLGAPGRVFVSGEPELACNVQHYPNDAYLRRAEAEQCHVQSSMLLPVFLYPSEYGSANPTLGVIEVVQTSDDMAFIPVAHLLGSVLIRCGLYTASVQEVEAKLPEAASNLPHLPLQTGLLDPTSQGDGSGEMKDESAMSPKEGSGHPGLVGHGQVDHDGENISDSGEDVDNAEDDSEDSADRGQSQRGGRMKGKHAAKLHSTGKGGRTIKIRNSGVNLTLADLQSQFGLGLKEAASSLGVCSTTLKRACRRHGIQRWPRRALQRVSRALDEIERRGNFQGGGHMYAEPGFMAAPQGNNGAGYVPPMDTRWATLASMLPNFGPHLAPMTGTWMAGGEVEGPKASTVSLEGAVAISRGVNNAGSGPAVVSGFTQWNSGGIVGGTAAAAQAAAQHGSRTAPASRPPPSVVPAFLKPDIRPAAQYPSALMNGVDLVGFPAASFGPGYSLPNLSQLSVPSLGQSLMFGLTSGGFGGDLSGLVSGGYDKTVQHPRDDVGLLDSTILELILSEDSRGLVGASDADLKLLFGNGMGGSGTPGLIAAPSGPPDGASKP